MAPTTMESVKTGSKRRTIAHKGESRKRAKVMHHSADTLSWKSVFRPHEAGMGGDDGILDLEEVNDVEVVYENTEHGRVVIFKVPDEAVEESDRRDSVGQEDIPSVSVKSGQVCNSTFAKESRSFDSQSLLPNWHPYPLHPHLLRSLHTKGFSTPTPIQAQAIPVSLKGRDIVGIAETGSGKTLAYGLPILHHLVSQFESDSIIRERRQLKALILAPTRELALQVSSHLKECVNPAAEPPVKDEVTLAVGEPKKGKGNQKGKKNAQHSNTHSPSHSPPLVSIAAIVGGMSSQKQQRILDRGVDVLVATPGRLWDILEEDDNLAKQVKRLKFLVLDEADRMIEAGHFAELDNILRLTLRTALDEQTEPEINGDVDEERQVDDGKESGKNDLQTFVFSATLSKDLQRNLKRRSRPLKKGKKSASTLDDLLLRLDFRDPEPEVIDISPEGGVVESLRESKIACLGADKDVYLYYFLLRYPGRSLVFLSSIDGIRRLMPLAELLNLKAFPLHSQLEQRQRLNNLDRFKSTPNSVLLATDIAARGLDIPSVDHVIHYQIPRTADAYVHRNGRTARAMRKGFSMLMCAPEERRLVRALFGSLGREESHIPEMAVELSLLDKLKARVTLARRIDKAQHTVKKENHEKNWMRETAAAMEIELGSDFSSSNEDDAKPSKHRKRVQNSKTASLKAELKHMLSQPLLAQGVSVKYITSGSRPIADSLLDENYHDEPILGVKKAEASSGLLPTKKKQAKKHEREEEEEWYGFGT